MTEDTKESLRKVERILGKILKFLLKPSITVIICLVLSFFLVRGAFTSFAENSQMEIQK